MPGITFEQAARIIETLKALKYWRDILKKIDAAHTIEISINHKTGRDYYGKPVTEQIKYNAAEANSKIARSIINAVRHEWEIKEADCVRTLIQLGAEVPE